MRGEVTGMLYLSFNHWNLTKSAVEKLVKINKKIKLCVDRARKATDFSGNFLY